jgi:hypothetical protein
MRAFTPVFDGLWRVVFLQHSTRRPGGSRDCVLSVPDGWYRIKSRAQMGSNRQDKFMKIEIEYCGQ